MCSGWYGRRCKINFIFRAVLVLQQNQAESTKCFHIHTPTASPTINILHQSGTFVTIMDLHIELSLNVHRLH